MQTKPAMLKVNCIIFSWFSLAFCHRQVEHELLELILMLRLFFLVLFVFLSTENENKQKGTETAFVEISRTHDIVYKLTVPETENSDLARERRKCMQ